MSNSEIIRLKVGETNHTTKNVTEISTIHAGDNVFGKHLFENR